MKAIVAFHDQINDVHYDAWWSSGLLKEVGRDHIHEVLKANGYDGIIVDDPDWGHGEYIVFDSRQIKHATENCGAFDTNSPDIYR